MQLDLAQTSTNYHRMNHVDAATCGAESLNVLFLLATVPKYECFVFHVDIHDMRSYPIAVKLKLEQGVSFPQQFLKRSVCFGKFGSVLSCTLVALNVHCDVKRVVLKHEVRFDADLTEGKFSSTELMSSKLS